MTTLNFPDRLRKKDVADLQSRTDALLAMLDAGESDRVRELLPALVEDAARYGTRRVPGFVGR